MPTRSAIWSTGSRSSRLDDEMLVNGIAQIAPLDVGSKQALLEATRPRRPRRPARPVHAVPAHGARAAPTGPRRCNERRRGDRSQRHAGSGFYPLSRSQYPPNDFEADDHAISAGADQRPDHPAAASSSSLPGTILQRGDRRQPRGQRRSASSRSTTISSRPTPHYRRHDPAGRRRDRGRMDHPRRLVGHLPDDPRRRSEGGRGAQGRARTVTL